MIKKSVFGAALAATALASATPAMADPYGYHRHGGGDTAGAAILGGIVGLTIGAIAASASNNHRDRCYNDRDQRYRDYYRRDGRCYRDRNGGYYDNYPQQGGYYGNYPQQGGYYGNYPAQGGYYDPHYGRYADRRGYGDGDRDDD
ncbi:MAG: hypothetical protein KGM49_06085 [Sphingomonadales bacterium]|nr:hypothetical protein [Sphingomonadales bacterium]